VAADGVIIEGLNAGRSARPGEVGESVATPPHALAMPFIRCRLGDTVRQGEGTSTCGAPSTTLFTVHARVLDHLPLANGRLLHPYRLVGVLLDQATRWIGQYRLIQERHDRVVLQVSPRLAPSSQEIHSVEEAARGHLGPGIEFQVFLVPEIPLDANG